MNARERKITAVLAESPITARPFARRAASPRIAGDECSSQSLPGLAARPEQSELGPVDQASCIFSQVLTEWEPAEIGNGRQRQRPAPLKKGLFHDQDSHRRRGGRALVRRLRLTCPGAERAGRDSSPSDRGREAIEEVAQRRHEA
jgi:hypothetical protein